MAVSLTVVMAVYADVIPIGPPQPTPITYGDVTTIPGGFVAIGGRLIDEQTEAIGQRFDLYGAAVGSAFQIITPYPDYELHIASNASGRLVATWQNGLGGFGDEPAHIFARRFDADGAPLGDAVQVNAYPTEEAFYPDVAVAADGSFLVIWQGDEAPYILAQRYDRDGQAAGENVQVSEPMGGLRPAVVALADGSFVVTWLRGYNPHTSIWARRVSADGLGVQAPIADNAADNGHPKVTALGDGYIVTWTAYVDYEHGEFDKEIWAGTFDALGNSIGANAPISTGLTDVRPRSYDPEPASDGEGFVVVWSSTTYYDEYPGDGIFGYLGPFRLNAARMDSEGTRTDDFDLAADPEAAAYRPKIAMHGDGTFMVVWSGYTRAFCDTAGRELGCGTTRCLSAPHSATTIDVRASDALTVLRAAVGAETCPRCVCDVDNSGDTVAADALRVLRRSVGVVVALTCPPC